MPSFAYTLPGGLRIERLGGNVRIHTTTTDDFGNTTVRTVVVSGVEWATAVAAVSVEGETTETVRRARQVHEGG